MQKLKKTEPIIANFQLLTLHSTRVKIIHACLGLGLGSAPVSEVHKNIPSL